jgi:hypothetical protein
MESLSLTHPVERYLLGLTLIAILGIVYWKAWEPDPVRNAAPSPLVQSL